MRNLEEMYLDNVEEHFQFARMYGEDTTTFTNWMLERLRTFVAEAREGRTNGYYAGMAITERLYERRDISQDEYNNLIKIFNKNK